MNNSNRYQKAKKWLRDSLPYAVLMGLVVYQMRQTRNLETTLSHIYNLIGETHKDMVEMHLDRSTENREWLDYIIRMNKDIYDALNDEDSEGL